ncbi:MAG: D-alanyl-D-alanine carboxypeptidase/D-alanyl-D-alanine-endopeptidase [Planctomycetes bacterium]|nr:D-alanyl-D-alanine carboxypeptidase/D-alanyl-D-alanine-endopeptidase [Planctomycetota bacterium]
MRGGRTIAAAIGIACASSAAAPAPPEPSLAASIDAEIDGSGLRADSLAVLIRSLDAGEVLYARRADRAVRPASNLKLFTAAAALLALGPDFRFETRILATGAIAAGELRGDLIVEGRGDPTISGRFTGGDILAAFKAWAGRLGDLGVRRITGRIIGDDRYFQGPSIGDGWEEDDLPEWYAAETSALTLNDGCVDIHLRGTKAREAPEIRIDPPTRYVRVACKVRTAGGKGAARIGIHRPRDRNEIELTGTIPAGTRKTVWASVHDPTLYFVTVLRETLAREGIEVAGAAVDANVLPAPLPAARLLFSHTSPALSTCIEVVLKRSQNHYAENVARTIAAVRRGRGTMVDARIAIADLLEPYGAPRGAIHMADGSGLSDKNRATADAIVRLLDGYRRAPTFAAFREALPIAGVDGSVRSRLKGTRAAGRVRAKTGTIANVRSLCGYLETIDGETIAFAFLADGHGTSAAAVDRVIDRILVRLVELPRKRGR